jgi:hypothetical protein
MEITPLIKESAMKTKETKANRKCSVLISEGYREAEWQGSRHVVANGH